MPNASITFTPGATSATTTFDPGSNTWLTSAPASVGGNIFLAGLELPVPAGLPEGIDPVTWQANFHTDAAGVTVNWQWAAAVYTHFGSDYNAVEVKPVDGNSLSAFTNSDHAGTPEAFRAFVVGGARGGGGSNFTGSYSPTGHVSPDVSPPTFSLSGAVFQDNNLDDTLLAGDVGVVGATVILTDSQGNVIATTTTGAGGAYHFSGLGAGSYTISYVDPVNGGFGSASGVVLGPGLTAVHDFAEPPAVPGI